MDKPMTMGCSVESSDCQLYTHTRVLYIQSTPQRYFVTEMAQLDVEFSGWVSLGCALRSHVRSLPGLTGACLHVGVDYALVQAVVSIRRYVSFIRNRSSAPRSPSPILHV